MSHLHGESIQIVRKQQKGEPIPDYSTAALLFGCTFGFRQVEKPQEDFSLVLISGKNRAERDLAVHGNAIREMLKEYKGNPEIAETLGITSARISAATCLSDELRELSEKRRIVSCQKGGRSAGGEHSWMRFNRNKEQIIADIDAIGISKASQKWRMDSRTIWKFLEKDEKNAQS